MKKIQAGLMGVLFLVSSSLLAHGGGHKHAPIKKEQAKAVATKAVEDTIKKGKLEKTWSASKANEPTQKSFGHGPEWVVSFDNLKIKDKSKQKVFVFLSLGGEVLGINFTGK